MVNGLSVKENYEDELFLIPGVVGVGFSEIYNIIFVYVKELTVDIVKSIPVEIQGIPVLIVEIGEVSFLQERTDKWRPAPGGVSIGHYRISAGTLGTAAIDNISGRRVILSNNHVLANMDSKQNPRANKGDAIYQPGPGDGGSSADTIAELERWIKYDEEGKNPVDCAIGMPINDADLRDDILEIGTPVGITEAIEGATTRKSGRTTGLTSGTITDIHWSGTVSGIFFTDQVKVSGTAPQVAGGDSGSAAINKDDNVIGLLFAGPRYPPRTYFIANKMTNVAEQLNISIGAPPPPPPPTRRGLGLMIGGGAALMLGLLIPAKR